MWQPAPLPRAAALTVAVVVVACVLALVTLIVQDTDLWTLLAQGRAIWSGVPPTSNQWTWLTWGEPQIASSWGFRALLWPLWNGGGVWGVFAWRWISTLAVFAMLYATARTMKAPRLITMVVLVACAVVYRERSEARPETLAAVLFTFSFWILEGRRWGRRWGRRDWTWALPAVALIWANVHVSYYLLLALVIFHALDASLGGRTREGPSPRWLWTIAAASLAASFVNPSGWRALWVPFQFFFEWRGDPMFGTIEELRPLWWRLDWRRPLPAMLLVWPALVVVRARWGRLDRVEALAVVAFSAAAIASQRFSAVYVLAAAPFLARDLGEWAARAWPVLRVRFPALARGWTRAALAVAACLALALPELFLYERPLGVGIHMPTVPAGAADFMEREGIRGRGFHHMHFGGYLSHRFWPDRERAPFVTTQPELSDAGTRAGYIAALRGPDGWQRLDRLHRFDYVLLETEQDPGDHLLDVLDRDSSWVMVFADDAAELYLRYSVWPDVAQRHGYRMLPGGREGRVRLVSNAERDPTVREQAIRECERAVSDSRWNGRAHRLLGFFALMEGRPADARSHFEETLRQHPGMAGVRERLGLVAMNERRPGDAVRLFERELRMFGANPRLNAALAKARDSLEARRVD